MIALALCLASLTAAGQEAPTPGSLISNLMTRYASASTMSGHVEFSQSAQNVTVHITTDFAYIRPNRIFIHQTTATGDRPSALLVSDGQRFAYDRPPSSLGPPRFVERVSQNGRSLSLGDFYSAAHLSLLDRSPALDIAIGANLDLRKLREQWSEMQVSGTVQEEGVSAFRIIGNWRDRADHPVLGTFSMDISQAGDLVRYEQRQKVGIPREAGGGTVDVTSIWTSTIKVEAPVDSSIFTDIR